MTTQNPFTAALIADGRVRLGARGTNASDRECWCAADLNAVIAAIGGARGLAHRGRLVVTAPDGIFVWNLEGNDLYSREAIVTQYATVAEAEAFARRERVGDAAFRAAAQAIEERAQLDGPRGYGR